MNRLLSSFLTSFALASLVTAQEMPSPPHSSTSAPPSARYEIVQSELAARWTFLLDKYAGTVQQLVKDSSDNVSWEKMVIVDPAQPATDHVRYQIFTSGLAARHTFLLNVDSGKTWQIQSSKVKNLDGSETEIVGWFPLPKQ
jgi:hypothetical protein